jgi:hypothetical protein
MTISNAAYIKTINKSQKVVKEWSAKMATKFQKRVVPYFP